MNQKKPITNTALQSWEALNEFVMACIDEEVLTRLLEEEMKGRKRKQFVMRIHSRINKIRADNERAKLMGQLT